MVMLMTIERKMMLIANDNDYECDYYVNGDADDDRDIDNDDDSFILSLHYCDSYIGRNNIFYTLGFKDILF